MWQRTNIRNGGRVLDDPYLPYEGQTKITGQELAQHNFAGPDVEALMMSLAGKRVNLAGFGRPGGPGLSLAQARPGDEDAARTIAANEYLTGVLDQRDMRNQAQKDIAAHNDDRQMALSDRSTVGRAMAIANTPGVSAEGRPIRIDENGRSVTEHPTGMEPPVNRQAIAAQMAPGLIAPPPPLTFVGAPVKASITVDGKTKNTFVRTGSDGNTYDMGRRLVDPNTIGTEDKTADVNPDIADSVKGMMDGTLPPQLPGRASKDYTAIMAEAKRQGYDLATAATDWTATQKHIQTMNGAQQLRLNQAVNALPDMLDSVESLAGKWKGGKFPILNKANLALAKGGALGPEAATIANQLDAQIADVVADLGNVYMGGNSPTDHALSLAGKSLSAEWDEKVLKDMVALAKKNVTIRQNSIRNTGVAGASPNNPYGNQPAAAAAPPAAAGGLPPLGAGEVYATDPQGNVHKGKAGAALPPGWKLGGG